MAYLIYIVLLLFLCLWSCVVLIESIHYEANWASLDSRPLPSWYDESKFGIFIVWGVYSVPGFQSEWFWDYWKDPTNIRQNVVDFMKDNYPPSFTYPDFAAEFTAEFYNPEEWADIFNASGAKYIVFTTKHADGYTNWPSKFSYNWNSNATGPSRDIVGELANAIRQKTNIKFGLYHCLYEWFNPLYINDMRKGFTTNEYAEFKTIPSLYELVNNYKPDIVWADGDFGPDVYWKSQEFLAWLYNDSPVKDTVVVNDRWGYSCPCVHGGYYTCTDRFNPGILQKHKWENCMTIYHQSWGYIRNAQIKDFLSIKEIVDTLVSTVSCGGNMLMDVGPTKDGRIIPMFEERLRQLGSWLGVNGEAIYSTIPWSHQNDTLTEKVWYTSRKNINESLVVYAILLSWPDEPVLKLGAPIPSPTTVVSMLGFPDVFSWNFGPDNKGIYIEIPTISWHLMPCDWAWTLKFTYLEN